MKEGYMARTATAKRRVKAAATTHWDVVDYLSDEKKIAAYFEAALEDGDPQVFMAAIGDVARARGMVKIARETGLTREGLYKSFAPGGNPSYATVAKVAGALGVTLSVRPVRRAATEGTEALATPRLERAKTRAAVAHARRK
jgi:probable addiction module antidote protein